MKLKRAVLAELGRGELKEIVERLELDGVDRRSAEAMREAIDPSRASVSWKSSSTLASQFYRRLLARGALLKSFAF